MSTDLYYKGTQNVPLKSVSMVTFDAQQISIGGNGGRFCTTNPVNLVGFTKLNITYSATNVNSSSYLQVYTCDSATNTDASGIILGSQYTTTDGSYTQNFALSNAQVNKVLVFKFINVGSRYISRIWLS